MIFFNSKSDASCARRVIPNLGTLWDARFRYFSHHTHVALSVARNRPFATHLLQVGSGLGDFPSLTALSRLFHVERWVT